MVAVADFFSFSSSPFSIFFQMQVLQRRSGAASHSNAMGVSTSSVTHQRNYFSSYAFKMLMLLGREADCGWTRARKKCNCFAVSFRLFLDQFSLTFFLCASFNHILLNFLMFTFCAVYCRFFYLSPPHSIGSEFA